MERKTPHQVHWLKHKVAPSPTLLGHAKWVERQTGSKVKCIRSDGGGECAVPIAKLSSHGVEINMTAPYSPNETGREERLNRTLLDAIRTILHQAKLPRSFRAEALPTAVYARNVVPKKNKHVSPYEQLFGTKPHIKHLGTFGFRVFKRVSERKHQKLSVKAEGGIFMRSIKHEIPDLSGVKYKVCYITPLRAW